MKHARGQNKLFQNATILMCFCSFGLDNFIPIANCKIPFFFQMILSQSLERGPLKISNVIKDKALRKDLSLLFLIQRETISTFVEKINDKMSGIICMDK